MHFLSPAFFLKLMFPKISFGNSIRVTNSLDPDQDQHLFGPDLDSSCLQMLSADDKSCHFLGKSYVRLLNICLNYQNLVLAQRCAC